MKKFIALLILLVSCSAFAQEVLVQGTVKDAEGGPLPGVAVLVSGTGAGTVSDESGSWSIQVKGPSSILVFNCIGYTEISERVGNRKRIDITLQPSSQFIEESVVVGYGSLRKKDLTGAVGVIKADAMENRVLLSVDDALAGGVAGLMVSSASGKPGSVSNMLIRGANSLNGSSSPLIVVDGFPLFDVTTSGGGISAYDTGLSSLSMINTDDIASIEVLKDASATAIYGNRGSNGVILITTKKGRQDGSNIQYNSYVGIQEMTRRYKMMDFGQYAAYQAEKNTSNSLFYDRNALVPRNFDDGIPTTDWQDQIYRRGFIQNHSLSISSSSKKTNFLLSGSFQQDKSILICTNYRKFTTKAAVDHYFTDHVRMGVDMSYSRINDDGAPTGGEGTGQNAGIVTSALIAVPYDLTDENTQTYFRRAGVDQVIMNQYLGNWHGNPVTQAYDTQLSKTINRTILNGYLEVDIFPDLLFRTTAGYDVYSFKDRQFYPTTTGRGWFYSGQGIIGNSESTSWVNENTLTWRPVMGRHRLNVVAGFTEQGYTSYWDMNTATQYQYEALGYNNASMATVFEENSSKGKVTYLSMLFRANYTFDDRYIATITGRRDGTSRFLNKKWGNFFSGALAWNIDSEPWMRNLRNISTMKLRLSLGQVGNSDVPTSGSYSQLGSTFYSFDGLPAVGQYPVSIANENLTWETTTEENLGFELGLFNDRFSLSADLYNKETRDLLLEAPIMSISGFERSWQNIGRIRNIGAELSMNAVLVNSRNVKWSVNANFTRNRTKIIELGQSGAPIYLGITCLSGTNAIILDEGGEVGNIFGYETIGVYGLNDFEEDGKTPKPGVAVATGSERPGAMRIADLNEDGKITSDDRTVIGNTMPDFYGALGTSLSYRNIALDVSFQYSVGADIYNANYNTLAKYNAMSYNQMAFYEDRWSPDNTSSTMYNSMTSGLVCSAFVEDGSFLRMRNLRLSYSIPERWFPDKTHISGLRAYASADNLFVLTNYSGYDPEVSNSTNILKAGFDYGCFPRPKTFTFGINLTLK